MEAEFIAGAQATSECGWIRQLLYEILQVQVTPRLRVDNQSAIMVMKNEMVSTAAKHIAIRYFFVKDELTKKHIEVKWVETKNQLADILTKGLAGPPFEKLRADIRIVAP